MLQTLKNAWKIPDLRRRILFTLMMLIVFRFGAHIPVPYLTADAMQAFLGNGGTDLFSLFDVFTGGAFSNATVMAMGVSPYINASIIVQLLTVAIPSLERLAKEGLEGRKKINKITRYLGIALAFIQGAGLYVTLYNMSVTNGLDAIKNPSVLTFFVIVLTFTAGTAFIIWLGELITEKGLGNGVSLIIFAGIVSRIPSAAYGIEEYRFDVEHQEQDRKEVVPYFELHPRLAARGNAALVRLAFLRVVRTGRDRAGHSQSDRHQSDGGQDYDH